MQFLQEMHPLCHFRTLPLFSRLVPDDAFPEIFVLNLFLVILNFKAKSGGNTQKQYSDII